MFYHVLCAVSMSVLCGGKCGIVIPGIISSKKSSYSDSSVLLVVVIFEKFVVADSLELVQSTYCTHPLLLQQSVVVSRLFILQLVPSIDLDDLNFVSLLWFHCLVVEVRLFVFTVGSSLVKMDSVVGQLGTQLVKSCMALVALNIGKGIVVVIIPTSTVEGAGCKMEKEYAIKNENGVKRKRLNDAILETKAKKNKAVVIIASKYKKIGQGKEILQPHELIEMRTCSRMMNATDKWRNRNKSNLKENNRLRTNNNPNHNNPKCKKTQKQMKTKYIGVQSQ
ncbi:MAG: hypothetical protein EZS28_038678 [Streblomastix strix]|uniref:Uncharacterized protein n=1 Tax=Streblomastix strix TaxID=222440 RepID=A0A5J4U4U2_9EUKA|nr:MAG: hypothetical protein EZS28_038678 [Streblomastix strix]